MKKFLKFDFVLLVMVALFCLSCAGYFLSHRAAAGHYQVVTAAGGAETKAPEQSGKLNLNTASAKELMELPGIGAVRAEAIVAYREAHGPFQSIDELTAVEGIGERTVEKLRDYAAVE